MNKNEIASYIKKVEVFNGISNDDLELVANYIFEKNYTVGEYLFLEKSDRKNLFMIVDGEVEVYKLNHFEDRHVLRTIRKNEILGEGALLETYPHNTSAVATKECQILILDITNFSALMNQKPSLAAKIISNIAKIISRRIRRTTDKSVGIAAQYMSGSSRQEHDLLGYKDVPNEVYYGIQTLRAVENFSISGQTLNHHPLLIKALAQVKLAAARANHHAGHLDDKMTDAIVAACNEIIGGRYHLNFVVDMFQGGAGTSTNMNANEVIANIALEILGHSRGEYKYCHPNEHVNLSQSTNDAYPTSLKVALVYANKELVAVLEDLIASFRNKAKEFAHIIKMGRTQLQDAVPMTLGQEFEAYAVTLSEEVLRLNENANLFLEVNMGGTAIGTGLNADPKYRECVVPFLAKATGIPFVRASNLVEATQDTGAFVIYASAVKRLATKLSKICNDLRLLSSGPRAGLKEINLPAMQPGSSIMPGKVNPVIPEVVNQIAFNVIGKELTITIASEAGQLELNVMEPVIAQSLFEMNTMLKNGMKTLKYRCIDGITANEDICRKMVENSIGIITALNPILGYETCSELARIATETNASVYELVLSRKLMSKEELEKALSPANMI